MRVQGLIGLTLVAAIAAGCSSLPDIPGAEAKYPRETNAQDARAARVGKVTGDGITLFGGSSTPSPDASGSGIAVNSFLWRASLDSIGFMPLSSADPFGGVIITDWYSPPSSPNERFKVTVYVLDRQLRSDGVRAQIFRQTREPGAGWVDAAVDPKSPADLENAILTRARQLRLDTAALSK